MSSIYHDLNQINYQLIDLEFSNPTPEQTAKACAKMRRDLNAALDRLAMPDEVLEVGTPEYNLEPSPGYLPHPTPDRWSASRWREWAMGVSAPGHPADESAARKMIEKAVARDFRGGRIIPVI